MSETTPRKSKSPYSKLDIELANCIRAKLKDKFLTEWDIIWGEVTRDFTDKNLFSFTCKKIVYESIISQVIDIKTERNLHKKAPSKSTIMRLFQPEYADKAFQNNIATDLCLYLGYQSLDDFIVQNKGSFSEVFIRERMPNAEPIAESEASLNAPASQLNGIPYYNRFRRKSVMIAILFGGFLILFILFISLTSKKIMPIGIIKIDTIETYGHRNTVDVEFSTKECKLDCLKINFGEFQHIDPVQKLQKISGKASFYYNKPLCTQIRLMNGSSVLDSVPLIINSNGWCGWYSYFVKEDGEDKKYQSELLQGSNIFRNKELHISQDSILAKVHSSDSWTKFRNIQDFHCPATNFGVQFTVQNSIETGGIALFDTQIGVFTDAGQIISVFFQDKGAHYWAGLYIDKRKITGTNGEPLPKLAQSFKNWRDIELRVVKKELYVFIDQELLYTFPCPEIIGTIHGLEVAFRGSGSCKDIKLYQNKTGKLVYSLN